MTRYNCFPFTAIVGQEKVKKALIINYINPRIGGVLLCGEKGTAKSTLVRGFEDVVKPSKLIELPLNITEDRLLGGIDLKEAVAKGKKTLDRGLLQKAQDNLLYIDEVNLLAEHIVNILMEVSSTGYIYVEREGISTSFKTSFSLIGSMNPEEGRLSSHFLDRFGLYVTVEGEKDRRKRCEIINRRLEYEKNPCEFIKTYTEDTSRLRDKILKGKENLKEVAIPEKVLEFSADLSQAGNCHGHRAELTLIEAGRALAALYGSKEVTKDIIKEAAEYVLPHRIKETVTMELEREDAVNEDKNQPPDMEKALDIIEPSEVQSQPPESKGCQGPQDQWEDIDKSSKKISFSFDFQKEKTISGSGKRNKVRSDTSQGRYVNYKNSKDKITDIAVDATIRSAVMHPSTSKDLKITVKTEDIKEKVREERTGATIVFLVDASGSMGAKKRMGAVKGAIMELLNDAYQKRDLISMISFKDTSSQVLLPITRSVDLAEKHLKSLKTGGKSPLTHGLMKAFEILKGNKIKNPYSLQYLVVVTDGKANIPLWTGDSFEDAMEAGKKIRNEGIHSMVIDTESGFITYGLSKKLSEIMEAKYMALDKISSKEVKEAIQVFVKN